MSPPSDSLPLLLANWKMHGDPALVQSWLHEVAGSDALDDVRVGLFAPFTLLQEARRQIDAKGAAIALGAQNLHEAKQGAHTGEISADMLVQAGCGMVLVGHSERRCDQKETDAQVAAKAQRAREAGLQPVICVGETRAQRQAGEAEAVLERQLAALRPLQDACDSLILAYEPVWAIGTGQAASGRDIEQAHRHIRAQFQGGSVVLLYGGSVNCDNIQSVLASEQVDGALVGGASLRPEEFSRMLTLARNSTQQRRRKN